MLRHRPAVDKGLPMPACQRRRRVHHGRPTGCQEIVIGEDLIQIIGGAADRDGMPVVLDLVVADLLVQTLYWMFRM